MLLRTLGLVLLMMGTPATSGASQRVTGAGTALATRERQLWNLEVHDTNFADMAYIAARSRCEATQPPLALATPDPVLDELGSSPITVSFIVGIDGRVHDPLVLVSSGPQAERIVLKVVGSWRYRPATCNGVATEAEGKIAFSSR
jgi:hypothetical protein